MKVKEFKVVVKRKEIFEKYQDGDINIFARSKAEDLIRLSDSNIQKGQDGNVGIVGMGKCHEDKLGWMISFRGFDRGNNIIDIEFYENK